MKMNILVIDGQGGRIGAQVISGVRAESIDASIIAVGTNTTATAAMLKAGADNGATGENAVIVNARKADVIVGPIGIVVADSLFGEVTAAMAVAVGRSDAKKLFIPVNHCNNIIVGVSDLSMGNMIKSVVAEINNCLTK